MKRLALLLSLLLLLPPLPVSAQFPVKISRDVQSDTLDLFFIGDIMSHGAVRKSAEKHGYDTFFKYIQDRIEGADMSVGNMEFPLAGEPYSGYPAFSGPDSYAEYLSRIGFDLLLTANNHILDKGAEGLDRTIRALERMDIPYTGIAADAASDTLVNPTILLVKGVRIALVSCTYGTNVSSNAGWPKVNYLDKKRLGAIMERARAHADLVLVFPHWGIEYEHFHNAAQEDFARWLVSCGADAIIGAHPHVIQDVGTIDGVPVVYSLGNALSNQNDLPSRLEAALTLRVVRTFGEPLKLLPLQFDYLWCTKPGMLEDSYAAVPVTIPESFWRDKADYRNMSATLDSLREKGLILTPCHSVLK